MKVEEATSEQLQQALVERQIKEREEQRIESANTFMNTGVNNLLESVNTASGIGEVYKLANNFTSRYVRARKILGLPVGTRGRKRKD